MGSMRWCYPAGSPTATICALVPSPDSRRSWVRSLRWPRPDVRWWESATASRCCARRACSPALQKNAQLKFVCGPSILSVAAADTPLARGLEIGRHLSIPVNHFEGNYTVDPVTLTKLRAEERIVFRYVNNPNGSMDDIAGVCNEARNVVGLMPHPERAAHELLGSTDGKVMMQALVESASQPVPA